METVKKLINYYWSVIKKYGLILPIAIVVVGFGAMLALDLTNAFSALLRNGLAWFIILAILAVAAVAVGAIFAFKKIGDKELGIHDLVLTCIAALGVLMIIMFCFTSAANGMSLTKWLGTLAVTALCVVLAIFRTKNVD